MFDHTEIEHCYNTRSNNIKLTKTKYSLVDIGLLCMCIRLYNKLPENLRNIKDYKIFRKAVKQMLISSCFYSVDEYLNCKL